MTFEEALAQAKLGKNPSDLNPVEYRVLLLSEPIEKNFGGGVLEKTPAQINEEAMAQTRGFVCGTSDMAFSDERGPWQCVTPKIGDKVVFAKYAGQLIEDGDLTYRMVSDKDILAVVK